MTRWGDTTSVRNLTNFPSKANESYMRSTAWPSNSLSKSRLGWWTTWDKKVSIRRKR